MLRSGFIAQRLAQAVQHIHSIAGIGGMAGGFTPPGEDDAPSAPITSDQMRRWNNLIKFVKDKGYAGKEELDHDQKLRKKIFDEYNQANPDDSIPQEMVKPIQNEIQAYKQKALKDIAANPETYPGKVEDFMKGISQVDGIFGQKTSQWQFPSAYVDAAKTKSIGFAPKVDRQALMEVLKQ